MAEVSRKAPPDCLHFFLKVLHFPGISKVTDGRSNTASIAQLIEVLVNVGKYSNALAKETVLNALSDGLLVPAGRKTIKLSKNVLNNGSEEMKRVRLPREQETKGSSHDFYCYECHLPGILELCRQCTRSFHRLCYRKNPERPNYVVPSSKMQKHPLPTFSSASDTDSDENGTLHSSLILGYDSDFRTSSQLMVDQYSINVTALQRDSTKPNNKISGNGNSSIRESTHSKNESTNKINSLLEDKSILVNIEKEMKCPMDVVCLGEVRPPQRKRPVAVATLNVSYKNEAFLSDDDDADFELCTSCRLLKCADLQNPPNIHADELCFLINYTFLRNKNWMHHDVITYLENIKTPSKEISILTRLLFVPPMKRLTDIANKIHQKSYEFLMEFLIDLLDIQHDVAVFFGPSSTEMEATKWLLRDVTYDLSEIRRCADCFRYSHETSSSVWFAKPCVQRHELVFAKHSRFPYWPAKVIRVLPNNKYDVRFFGGNHSRALIDVRHIKPIDTDLRSLKLGNSSAIKKALQELHYHQMFSTYSPSIFSFHADAKQTEQVIQNILNRTSNTEHLASQCKPKRVRSKIKKTVSLAVHIVDNSPGKSNNNNNDSNESNNNNEVNCSNIANYNCGITTTTTKNKKNNNIYNTHSKNSNSIRNNSNKKLLRRMFSPNVCVKRLQLTNYVNDIDIIGERFCYTPRKRAINADDPVETVKILLKEVDDAHKEVKNFKAKNEKLQAQKLKLKEIIKRHESERKILKRKQWCSWCLKEAIFLCCFQAAYCSKICQTHHWQDIHSRECKNPSSTRRSNQT